VTDGRPTRALVIGSRGNIGRALGRHLKAVRHGILTLLIRVSHLASYSRRVALTYLRAALAVCRAGGVGPSVLVAPPRLASRRRGSPFALLSRHEP
jgi:hypothetical protein